MTLTIRNIAFVDIPSITEIADIELGKNYFSSDLWSLAQNEHTIFHVAEDSNNGIIGFCYSFIISKNKIAKKIKTNNSPSQIENTLSSVLKTIAVKEGFKRNGIGKLFTQKLINDLIERKIDSLYCVAWKSASATNIAELLHKFQFEILEEIPNYWTEESIEMKYACPECGDNGCYCSAVIYLKTLIA